jgi:hypothetical protein
MTASQFERLKSELEEAYQGASNAGRPMLLEGGLDWTAMSLSPRDPICLAPSRRVLHCAEEHGGTRNRPGARRAVYAARHLVGLSLSRRAATAPTPTRKTSMTVDPGKTTYEKMKWN